MVWFLQTLLSISNIAKHLIISCKKHYFIIQSKTRNSYLHSAIFYTNALKTHIQLVKNVSLNLYELSCWHFCVNLLNIFPKTFMVCIADEIRAYEKYNLLVLWP